MWAGWPQFVINKLAITLLHETDFDKETMRQRYPLLFQERGEAAFDYWFNRRQNWLYGCFIVVKVRDVELNE